MEEYLLYMCVSDSNGSVFTVHYVDDPYGRVFTVLVYSDSYGRVFTMLVCKWCFWKGVYCTFYK